MELAFLTPLLKDSANGISGGVAINNKGVIETRLAENRGGADGVNQGLKSRFMFIFPMKMATFHAVSHKSVKRGGEHAEIMNVHVVKVEETEECTQFAERCQSFSILNAIDFDWVHRNAIFTYDHTKIFDFCGFELTFLWFEIKGVVGEYV